MHLSFTVDINTMFGDASESFRDFVFKSRFNRVILKFINADFTVNYFITFEFRHLNIVAGREQEMIRAKRETSENSGQTSHTDILVRKHMNSFCV